MSKLDFIAEILRKEHSKQFGANQINSKYEDLPEWKQNKWAAIALAVMSAIDNYRG